MARIRDFDTYRGGYANAIVEIRRAHTTSLATVYTDEALTSPADNPQILVNAFDADGFGCGKFAQPLYVGEPYELWINSSEQTGVERPGLTSLAGEDGTEILGKPRASSFLRPLTDRLSNNILAADYGALGSSPAVNTATITIAIGQAAALGGGYVDLPGQQIQVTQLTVPEGVKLRGQGIDVTTIVSQEADNIVTVTGNGGGLEALTLDGVLLIAGSTGVYGDNVAPHFRDVKIQRFATGLHLRGAHRVRWDELSIGNCQIGAKLHGDLNVAGGSIGATLSHLQWNGGVVSTCLQFGIDLAFVDARVSNITFRDIHFDTNLDRALRIKGCQFIALESCDLQSNDTPLEIMDGTPEQDDETHQTKKVRASQCTFNGGSIRVQDTAQDVLFFESDFAGITWILTLPANQLALYNCQSDANTTISGDSTKLVSFFQADHGSTVGVTTDGTATKAWSTGPLAPGQIVALDVWFLANRRNGNGTGRYRRIAAFRKPPSTLLYDGQSANFTVGLVLTGAVSGASARIIADSDSGATGTLTLQDIVGAFLDNEAITDSATGVAVANGTLVDGGTVAALGSVEVLGTDQETTAGYDVSLTGVANEVEARVTGASGHTIEWTVIADMSKD